MEIRFAEQKDLRQVMTIDTNLPYISSFMLQTDLAQKRLLVGIEAGKIIATAALVPETNYDYTAIKRLYIDPSYNGRGYAQQMIEYIIAQYQEEKIGATPWITNGAMRHILEKQDFHLEYVFNDVWCFYSKQV